VIETRVTALLSWPGPRPRAFAEGQIDLILPTQRSLEVLARFDRVDALLAELREAPCPT